MCRLHRKNWCFWKSVYKSPIIVGVLKTRHSDQHFTEKSADHEKNTVFEKHLQNRCKKHGLVMRWLRDRERDRDSPSERVPTCAFPFARSCSLENPSSNACGKNVEVWRWESRKVLVVKIKISIESCLLVLCIAAVAQKVLLVKIRIARELLWSRARQTLFWNCVFFYRQNCEFWKVASGSM